MARTSDARQTVRKPRVSVPQPGARVREETALGEGHGVLPARAEDQPEVRPGAEGLHPAQSHDELAGSAGPAAGFPHRLHEKMQAGGPLPASSADAEDGKTCSERI